MNKKIERSYLEILSLNELNESNNPSDEFVVDLIYPPNFQLNRFFYKEIGKKHKWVDRLVWNEKQWIEYTASRNVKTYILKKKEDLVGFFELIFHKENNSDLSKKVDLCLMDDLIVIYCCGETLSDRESGNHFKVVKSQIVDALFHLSENQISKLVIAYEPVWAIGTGVTASSNQAQEMHAFIRSIFTEKYGLNIAKGLSILYGGSCKPSNAKDIFSKEDVDGGLIGGACLNANDFYQIIKMESYKRCRRTTAIHFTSHKQAGHIFYHHSL